MILTVTPNIALDRLVVVRGFQTGRQSRAQFGFTQAGGSGVHASQVIQALGGDSKAICIIDPQQGSLVESVEAGPRCSSADLERLVACLEANLAGCQLLVISGSLPPACHPKLTLA